MALLSVPFALSGCTLSVCTLVEGSLHIQATGSSRKADCPSCGAISDHVHSYYTRSPSDLPISEHSVRLLLRVRRFRCLNEGCGRRTFSEPLSDLIRPHARRTTRLAKAQTCIGFAVGAEAGAGLLARLRMPISPDTLLRMLHRYPLPDVTPPRVLGVDDWAWRRGRAWGTILLDIEKHCPVDVLPDRTADTLARWLKTHSGVEVVARDRSTEYARGITEGAPGALQVADRWHLLHNFRQVLERFFHEARARLQSLEGLDVARIAGPPSSQRRTKGEIAASEAARQARKERYEEVRRLHEEEGLNISQISRALSMSRITVRKYLSAETFPEWTPHPPRRSILAPYEAYLEGRWVEGCRSALALFRELCARGYSGSTRPVQRWAQIRRTEPHPNTPKKCRETGPVRPEAESRQGKLPAPRRLAWLLLRETDKLDPEEERLLSVLRTDPEVETAYRLACSYVPMIREQKVDRLDQWLTSASESGIGGLVTFTAGLRQDYAAVRAALSEPWSNGQAEGQINRLSGVQAPDVWPRKL